MASGPGKAQRPDASGPGKTRVAARSTVVVYNRPVSHALTTEPENAEHVDRRLVESVESFLDARLSRAELPPHLIDAIRYAVLGGGKMLRPLLAIRSCEAVGGDRADAIGPAAALELIHAFSLVHDDLPAMDDDDMRRGRPTLHVHAGEAMAILAGDAMMSLAFEIIGECDLDEQCRAAITMELARGTSAMIAGQVYDTLGFGRSAAGSGAVSPRRATEGHAETKTARAGKPTANSQQPIGKPSDREKIVLIHRNKTGALIRAACRIGGYCGAANPDQLGRLTDFGEAVGLMFQIVDDVLDVTQSSEHLGKASGKDIDAGKLTYPGVLGLEESRREIARLEEVALNALEPMGIDDSGPARHLADLCRYMAIRTK